MGAWHKLSCQGALAKLKMFMRRYFLFLTATIRYYRIRPYSHYANFCLFCKKKKLSTGSHFLVHTIFFNYQNFLNRHQTSKNAVEEYSQVYSYMSGDKVLCSMTAILGMAMHPSSGHLISRTWPIMRTRLQKRKIGDYKIFKLFAGKLYKFFVVVRTGPYTQINIVQIKNSVKRSLPRPRRK